MTGAFGVSGIIEKLGRDSPRELSGAVEEPDTVLLGLSLISIDESWRAKRFVVPTDDVGNITSVAAMAGTDVDVDGLTAAEEGIAFGAVLGIATGQKDQSPLP